MFTVYKVFLLFLPLYIPLIHSFYDTVIIIFIVIIVIVMIMKEPKKHILVFFTPKMETIRHT